MEFPFGRPVHSDVIPGGTIRLLSDAPSPKLFSPQGLYYDFNLESYATQYSKNQVAITYFFQTVITVEPTQGR
jgi:hypothetical protein